MLDGRGDDVSAVRLGRFAHSPDGQIVCFRASRSEHDFVRPRANQRRDLATRFVHGGTCLLAEQVHAGGVPVILRQVRHHRGEDTRIHWSRGAMIEIDSPHVSVSRQLSEYNTIVGLNTTTDNGQLTTDRMLEHQNSDFSGLCRRINDDCRLSRGSCDVSIRSNGCRNVGIQTSLSLSNCPNLRDERL